MDRVLQLASKLTDARIYVMGNTGRAASQAYNIELCEKRAAAVAEVLAAAGVPPA